MLMWCNLLTKISWKQRFYSSKKYCKLISRHIFSLRVNLSGFFTQPCVLVSILNNAITLLNLLSIRFRHPHNHKFCYLLFSCLKKLNSWKLSNIKLWREKWNDAHCFPLLLFNRIYTCQFLRFLESFSYPRNPHYIVDRYVLFSINWMNELTLC